MIVYVYMHQTSVIAQNYATYNYVNVHSTLYNTTRLVKELLDVYIEFNEGNEGDEGVLISSLCRLHTHAGSALAIL